MQSLKGLCINEIVILVGSWWTVQKGKIQIWKLLAFGWCLKSQGWMSKKAQLAYLKVKQSIRQAKIAPNNQHE